MSLADSGAAFEQHCRKISSDGHLHGLLTRQNILNLSSLAFAVGTPQSPPTDDQFKEFATGINNDQEMTFGELAQLRRLHFEASAIVMAELIKSKATQTQRVMVDVNCRWQRRTQDCWNRKPVCLA